MRGFFGIGVEGIHKPHNLGNLVRTTHEFGGSFFFTVNESLDVDEVRQSDTSSAFDHVPFHEWADADAMDLPQGCQLVGIELIDDSVELPIFRHPTRAAYVLGPEMGSLSEAMTQKCDHVVQIPMKFCVNVGVAGAIVIYDRMMSMGRWAERPVKPGGPLYPKEEHAAGPRRKIKSKN